MDPNIQVKKQSVDATSDSAVQSSRSKLDVIKAKLFTTEGYKKQALTELFGYIENLERRLSRVEKLTNG